MSILQVAIITGAGSGIGRAVAHRLAERGFAVVLAGRSEAPLREVASKIERDQGPGRALVVRADMSREGDAAGLIDAAVARFGRIDVLVNNAAIARVAPIGETSAELLRDTLDANTLGPGVAVVRAWATFSRQGGGCVVNVSSVASVDPFPGFFAYAASKAALNIMTASIAKEGAAIGVKAYGVAPGAVETPMLRAAFDTEAIPPEACLDPAEVARLIVDCVEGRRADDNGRTLAIVRDAGGTKVWALVHS